MFNFHRLDAFHCAIAFFKIAVPIADRTPPGYSSLGDQLRRAATSIALNIAEGSGRFNRDERRYFAMARGSALECAAVLELLLVLGTPTKEEGDEARGLLERIVSMLTKMSK